MDRLVVNVKLSLTFSFEEIFLLIYINYGNIYPEMKGVNMEKRKTVLASVEEFCNECRNNLFQIRQRYEKLKANLEFDYRNGKVSPKDYEKFKNVKIDEYVSSNYTLSLSEVNYVKKYASLNSSGEMMATLIDKKYLDYLDNLKVLYASVTTFSFFGSFSLDDRKSLFKDE